MHESIRRSELIAIGSFAMSAALKVPRELTCDVLERAVRWGRASTLPAHEMTRTLAGVEIRQRELEDGFEEIGATVRTATLVRVEEPLGRRTFRFQNELLGLPDGFEAHCPKARFIHLVFETALGGDSGACLRAIEILNEAVERGAKVSAHVEKFAASAHGDMFALVPGRRTMDPDARLLLHQGHAACFGDASQLRAAAEELEAWEVEHVERMARRTGQPPTVVRSWYLPAADVTFTAEAALASGLCDAIAEGAP